MGQFAGTGRSVGFFLNFFFLSFYFSPSARPLIFCVPFFSSLGLYFFWLHDKPHLTSLLTLLAATRVLPMLSKKARIHPLSRTHGSGHKIRRAASRALGGLVELQWQSGDRIQRKQAARLVT
jgi:hypothetical protein